MAPIDQMKAQGMLSCDAGEYGATEGGGRRWLIGDYEAGDAVFHHSCRWSLVDSFFRPSTNVVDTIHASGTNKDPEGRIRLSADLRFADKNGPHEDRWSKSVTFLF